MLRCIMGSCGLKNKYKRGIEAWCTAGSPQRVFQFFLYIYIESIHIFSKIKHLSQINKGRCFHWIRLIVRFIKKSFTFTVL